MIPAIVKELTESRKNQGVTQQELANQINVTRLSIGNWENGKQSPTLRKLELWAMALGYRLALDDLYFNKEQEDDQS